MKVVFQKYSYRIFFFSGTYYQENLGKNSVEIAIGIGFALCLIILLGNIISGIVYLPWILHTYLNRQVRLQDIKREAKYTKGTFTEHANI